MVIKKKRKIITCIKQQTCLILKLMISHLLLYAKEQLKHERKKLKRIFT